MATKPHSGNYLSQFKDHNLNKMKLFTAAQFVEVWHHYDSDGNGYIEGKELDKFLREFISSVFSDELGGEAIAEDDLELMKKEFMKTFDENSDNRIELCELKLFDQNKDGKLQLSEMARLLPVKENYLCRPIFKNASKITSEDIDRAFSLYDLDGNNTIEDEELSGFLKDLMELAQEDYDEDDLEFFKRTILNQWDVNNDGKINREELKMMLLQQSRLISKGQKTE
ncbi:hypothetical protein CRM22_009430 [Opisthorchis felineus]|uniref:EF-hand domain-containing protein n=1 Tax=Opisthorchis felineus TaxID=147828 RepID=A0A4V3SCZ9_OPIFE|nr:hypothetical protein CRM22_009430 [Opisthorchis felineus]